MRSEGALKREVVDGEEAWCRWAVGERLVRRRKSGLPVVGVDDLRAPADGALRCTEQGSYARELSEAQRIIVPVGAGRILVRPTVAVVKGGTIDDPCRHAAGQHEGKQSCGG